MKYCKKIISLYLIKIFKYKPLTVKAFEPNIYIKLYMQIEFKSFYFIVTSNRIVRFLGNFISLGSNAMAITFYPFLFITSDNKSNEELIRHETIHIRQQIELLIVGAWLLFILEYSYAKFVKKLDSRQAYYYTALEQEAHRNAMKRDYLCRRRPYATLKYIRDKKWLGRTESGQLIVRDY